jgi:hypothetical protein
MGEKTKGYWERSNAPLAGFMRVILSKKQKEKTMSEKKFLRFRKDTPAEPVTTDPKQTIGEQIEQMRKKAGPIEASPIKASETPIKQYLNESAPIRQRIEQKPRDVSAEIQTLITMYKGDLVKVQSFILENFEGMDLYTAGFQICLILTNERISRENALREIFENMRHGTLAVPFDPREDPMFITLLKKIAIPPQVPKQVPAKVPTHEDYTTKREQELATLRSSLDEMTMEPDGVAQ